MSHDALLALINLDQRTPAFFVDEMWSRGSVEVMLQAREILRGGLDLTLSPAALRTTLRIEPTVSDVQPYRPEDDSLEQSEQSESETESDGPE